MHVDLEYTDEAPEFADPLREVQEELMLLYARLQEKEKHCLHIVLEEEAAQKKGKRWVLKHRKIVEGDIKEEIDLEKEIIVDIRKTFMGVKEKLDPTTHIEDDEESKHILERLSSFVTFYEDIFRQFLAKLEDTQ